jgi:hypothetical protein
LPRVILVDTSIFDQQAYNFASAALTQLTSIAMSKQLTLLLPDPIEREVIRHIKERSHAALKALEDARRKAPFVSKWKSWPAERITDETKREIEAIAEAEWREFLKNFTVQRLGYTGVDMAQVMDWYDQQQPPFGEGGKRKEFPDAFALAAAIHYAVSNSTQVAAVSLDQDHQKTCARHSELLYFRDLPALIEAFIAEDVQIASIKQALQAAPDPLVQQIQEDFPELAFYPEEDPNGDVDDVTVKSVKITRTTVIELVGHETTIAFEARVRFSAHVSYDDAATAVIDSSENVYLPLRRKAGNVTETAAISGTAALQFDDAWRAIVAISSLRFDDQDITVTKEPEGYDDDDEPPDPPEQPQP